LARGPSALVGFSARAHTPRAGVTKEPDRELAMSMNPPVTIDVQRSTGLVLVWADGTTSRFELEELRRQCPCAACRHRRGRNLPVWPVAASPRPLRIVDAELVGAWGMSITWNDGHSTGIYSWDLFRGDEWGVP
jgi:DUF971 family protein